MYEQSSKTNKKPECPVVWEGGHSLGWLEMVAPTLFSKCESSWVSHMLQECSYPCAFLACFWQSFFNRFHQVFPMVEVGIEMPDLWNPARLGDEKGTELLCTARIEECLSPCWRQWRLFAFNHCFDSKQLSIVWVAEVFQQHNKAKF